MNEGQSRQEAIVFSPWGWEAHNIPERTAIALGRAGWRVLYCANPATFLRRFGEQRMTLSENVEGFRPSFVGHRVNALPLARRWQAKLLANVVLNQASQMGLKRPIVIYPHGYWLVDVAKELKRRGYYLVFVCIDYLTIDDPMEHAAPSDLTLAVPRTMYHILRSKFGEKVHLIPEFGPELAVFDSPECRVPAPMEAVPRPRMGYMGLPANRLHQRLIDELFAAHPEWHFVACGPIPGVTRPNVHNIGWLSPPEVAQATRGLDVGFMPYDCSDEGNLHCIPLKLFDYFASGLPVVSTPLIHLWEYQDMVYLGDTAEELAEGIRNALAEPRNDPRRDERRRIARGHSLEELSRILCEVLGGAAPAGATGARRKGPGGEERAKLCEASGQ